MNIYDMDFKGFKFGELNILIKDWYGPRKPLGLQHDDSIASISLSGSIDDPAQGPLGDIYEGHADSIYSFKTVRISISIKPHAYEWPFHVPSEIEPNLPPIIGVGTIERQEDHELHEGLDGIADFHLSVSRSCWDILLQSLQIAHYQSRIQSWTLQYLIPEEDLNPEEKEGWGGWASASKSLRPTVKPKHFDKTKTIAIGVVQFAFGNTVLPRVKENADQRLRPIRVTGRDTMGVSIKITRSEQTFSSVTGKVTTHKLFGEISESRRFSGDSGEAEISLEVYNEAAFNEDSSGVTTEDGVSHGAYDYYAPDEDQDSCREKSLLFITLYFTDLQLNRYIERLLGNQLFVHLTLDPFDWQKSRFGEVFHFSISYRSDSDKNENFLVQEVSKSISDLIPKQTLEGRMTELKRTVEQQSIDVSHKLQNTDLNLATLLESSKTTDEALRQLNKKFWLILGLIVLSTLFQI